MSADEPVGEVAVGAITTGQLLAAINANPQLRIEFELYKPDPEYGNVVLTARAEGLTPDLVMLQIPDALWSMLGRRRRVVAQLAIEDE